MPLTPQEYAISQALELQLRALAAERYRLTLFASGGRQGTYNPGKREDGNERFWTAAEVIEMVPELNRRNWQRSLNVFLTPFDSTRHYFLLDDLNAPEKRAAFFAAGYRPALQLRSSAASHQVILIVPSGCCADREIRNRAFRELNQEFGDTAIGGQVHPFRAAGFQNRKEKYRDAAGRYPLVKITATDPGAICDVLTARLRAAAAATPAVAVGPLKMRFAEAKGSPEVRTHSKPLPCNSRAFKAAETAYARAAAAGIQYMDRVDCSLAGWFLKNGFSRDEAAEAIAAFSPAAAKSGFATYLDRTLCVVGF